MFAAAAACGLVWPPPNSRYMLGNESVITSTCSAQYNTPCAISKMHEIVFHVGTALEKAASADEVWAVLARVNEGRFNEDYNFWPAVIDASGAYVASGIVRDDELTGARDVVGRNVSQVAFGETLLVQQHLWPRIQAAAADDGYFSFYGWDNHHKPGPWRPDQPYHSVRPASLGH